MLSRIAGQWRWVFSAVVLIGLAAFALVKGVSVLAQDTTNIGQPRQTVEAPAVSPPQRQTVPVAASGEGIPVEQATPRPPSGITYHTVQPGESLGKIAANYGVTVAALAGANGMTNPDLIRVGQKLVIPAR